MGGLEHPEGPGAAAGGVQARRGAPATRPSDTRSDTRGPPKARQPTSDRGEATEESALVGVRALLAVSR